MTDKLDMLIGEIKGLKDQVSQNCTKINDLTVDVKSIKDQTSQNCTKINDLTVDVKSIKEDTQLLPQILELVQANGNNHEELSKRVDKLEN